jgi:glucose-1-phosphate thymidylyltransferase
MERFDVSSKNVSNFGPRALDTGVMVNHFSSHSHYTPQDTLRIVGLIPAAGLATRLGLHSGSKELLPVHLDTPHPSSRVVSEFLLEQMVRAGCQRVFFILRPGKFDIIEYFNNGANFGLPVGYLLMDAPYGPPFTISQAFPFIEGASLLTGFPDILMDPPDVCEQIVLKLRKSQADVVLATFPCGPEHGCDLAEVDAQGHIVKIVPKEYNPVWRGDSRTWLAAAWQHSFTTFFADIVQKLRIEADAMPAKSNPEWPLGIIFVEALKAGMTLETVHFKKGRFLDIGTPERLAQASAFLAKNNEK